METALKWAGISRRVAWDKLTPAAGSRVNVVLRKRNYEITTAGRYQILKWSSRVSSPNWRVVEVIAPLLVVSWWRHSNISKTGKTWNQSIYSNQIDKVEFLYNVDWLCDVMWRWRGKLRNCRCTGTRGIRYYFAKYILCISRTGIRSVLSSFNFNV